MNILLVCDQSFTFYDSIIQGGQIKDGPVQSDHTCSESNYIHQNIRNDIQKKRTLPDLQEKDQRDICDYQALICDMLTDTYNHNPSSQCPKEQERNHFLPCPYELLKVATSSLKYRFETIHISKEDICGPTYCVVFSIDSYLTAAITHLVNTSQIFECRFTNFIREIIRRRIRNATQGTSIGSRRFKCDDVSTIFLLCPPAKFVINYPWCNRLQDLINKKVRLEESMAWLSTLGGGYSSLGDFVVQHAEEAGRISQEQLKVALKMGDPTMQCKCRMFYALSLMQKGQLKRSGELLRKEFHFIKLAKFQDEKVKAMWQALWIKLRYMKKLEKQRFLLLHGQTNGKPKHTNVQATSCTCS